MSPLSTIKHALNKANRKEHISTWGKENPDKTFYLIRRTGGGTAGLCSHLNVVLGHIRYAEAKGYIPVVDMQNYKTPYLSDELQGKENAWEYFFKQPANYGLDTVYKSKNVVYSNDGLAEEYIDGSMGFYHNEGNELSKWREIFKKWIRFSDEFKAYDNRIDKSIMLDKRVLGVISRGSDYVNLKPKGHGIQPTIPMLVEKVKEVVVEKKIDRVFLATEDETIFEAFEREFKDILISIQSHHISSDKDNANTAVQELYEDMKLAGMEYLENIYILSKCNCLIASPCNGSASAVIMSDGYEWDYYWDLGVYK